MKQLKLIYKMKSKVLNMKKILKIVLVKKNNKIISRIKKKT